MYDVFNDGIPEGLPSIAAGRIDATASQPAGLSAKYALYYLKAAVDGKTFRPGGTGHDSTIVGGTCGGVPGVRSDGTSLWGDDVR